MEPKQAERRPGRVLERQEGPVNGSIAACAGETRRVVCSDVWQRSYDFCHVRLFISKVSSSPDACVWTDGEQAGLEWMFTLDRAKESSVSRVVGVESLSERKLHAILGAEHHLFPYANLVLEIASTLYLTGL